MTTLNFIYEFYHEILLRDSFQESRNLNLFKDQFFLFFSFLDRAERKLKELNEQLEIAKLNFQQLGGVLNEDQRKIEEQKEQSR